MRMNPAQAFIFIVVQRGNEKRATLGETPSFSSAHLIASGIVLADDLLKKASDSAGHIATAVLTGEIPRHFSSRGKTMKAWTTFAPTTVSRYKPSVSNSRPDFRFLTNR